MNTLSRQIIFITATFTAISGCGLQKDINPGIPVIIDTDANNELDDQHALAYLFFNGNTFNVEGVTVNATQNGGKVEEHYKEAKRVMQLCNVDEKIPLLMGANGNFIEIKPLVKNEIFDGSPAVNFIIQQAHKKRNQKLVLLPVGKLTNIALALEKDSSIAEKIRIVWLGTNYPEPGEYNMENDVDAMNFVLSKDVPLEIVTVRYGKTTGSGFVKVTWDDISKMMPGKGPKVTAVEGRHGGSFTCFGDYSVNLFEHCEYYDNPPSRSLYDMTDVAIIKNPSFASSFTLPAPAYINGTWVEQPLNKRSIIIWENFNRDAIIADFNESLKNYVLPGKN